MSIQAIVDTCIHIHSFRNIDLIEQGVYMVSISLSHSSPYVLEVCKTRGSSPEKHKLVPAHLTDDSFFSRGFLLMYSEEEACINDLAVFRSELCTSSTDSPFAITVNLLFAPSNNSEDPPSEFSLVNSQLLTVERPLEGVNQFISVSFDGGYASQVNLCIHIIPLDFRYRFSSKQALSNAYDINKLTASLIFPKKKVVTDNDKAKAYNNWVKKLAAIYDKNKYWITKLGENINSRRNPYPDLDLTNHRCELTDPEAVTGWLIETMQNVSASVHSIQASLITLIKDHPIRVGLHMQKEYMQQLKEHWGSCIFRDVHSVSSLTEGSTKTSGGHHSKLAEMVRKTPLFANTDAFDIYQPRFLSDAKHHPVLFQDIFYSGERVTMPEWNPDCFTFIPNSIFKKKGLHMIVFAHGFQGSPFDVKVIKNTIASLRPDCLLLCSGKNEGETDGDIMSMGARLAEEVDSYIKDWCPNKAMTRLSFVGHSLGGVIIRAALPMLMQYSNKFHMFLTFSTPHLGCGNHSLVVDAGMWLLKKWNNSQCLQQLSLSDSENVRETFLYRLSRAPGLESFKHIALVSSFQDLYVPYHSARIEATKEDFVQEMTENIVARIGTNQINRIDVNYKPKKRSFDNWIGRTAHIEMLENEKALQMVIFSCAHFFE